MTTGKLIVFEGAEGVGKSTQVVRLAEHFSNLGIPRIVLQPWEGATTASILRDAGRREPVHLPAPLCRAFGARR